MEYFAGLDVSMEETHVCVVDRDGKIILEARAATAPKAIAAALAKGPAVDRVLFETGRMAPTLFHGLTALGLPVVCVESRQAYQALRLLAAHKTDRNDARGLAHLARISGRRSVALSRRAEPIGHKRRNGKIYSLV